MDDTYPNDVRDMSLDEASIVEFDAIELEKENIQPIKSGRSALALNHLFATSHADRATELATGHAKFQAELRRLDSSSHNTHTTNDSVHEGDDNKVHLESSLEDPLDAYVRYIKWIIENYPQGGQSPESGLLPLLDRAIRRFKDEDLYKNDPRLYRIFSTYTAMVEDPLDVLKFMMANEIATQVAMYYEDYSDYLERAGDQKKALEMLQLGIHRGAQPLQQIKKRVEQLESRIQEKRLLEQLQKEEEEAAAAAAAAISEPTSSSSSTANHSRHVPERRILGVKESASASFSTHANSALRGHQPIGSNAASRSIPAAPSSSVSTTQSRKPNNSRLTVFVDPTGERGERAAAKAAAVTTAAGPPTWRDIGSQQVRRKENIQDPVPWKGVQYHPSLSSSSKAPIAKLKVYRDDDTPGSQCTSNVVAGAVDGQESVALCAHTSMSETERLRKHPLSNLVIPTDSEALCPTNSDPVPEEPVFAVSLSHDAQADLDKKKRPLSRSEKSATATETEQGEATATTGPVLLQDGPVIKRSRASGTTSSVQTLYAQQQQQYQHHRPPRQHPPQQQQHASSSSLDRISSDAPLQYPSQTATTSKVGLSARPRSVVTTTESGRQTPTLNRSHPAPPTPALNRGHLAPPTLALNRDRPAPPTPTLNRDRPAPPTPTLNRDRPARPTPILNREHPARPTPVLNRAPGATKKPPARLFDVFCDSP